MRKKILGSQSHTTSSRLAGELDLAALCTALVTSEQSDAPIENALDGVGGPGGTRWIAAVPGEQLLTFAFDTPQRVRRVVVEIEDRTQPRTQALELGWSDDGGQSYRTARQQDFNFSPEGATFEREDWTLDLQGVTHLRLRILPDKGGQPAVATLTTLAVA